MARYQDKTYDEMGALSPEIAILPLGSFEQHGPHLPLGTDIYLIEALAEGVAQKLGAFLLPVQPISTCYEHRGKKGSVHYEAGVFYKVIIQIVESLYETGFRRVAILPGHGGIFVLEPAVRRLNAAHPDLTVIAADAYDALSLPDNPFAPAGARKAGNAAADTDADSDTAETVFGTADANSDAPDTAAAISVAEYLSNDIHAGDVETSLMLHLHPDLVDMSKAADFVPEKPRPYLNYGSIFTMSPSGVWGYAARATAEKGKWLYENAVNATAKRIAGQFAELTKNNCL